MATYYLPSSKRLLAISIFNPMRRDPDAIIRRSVQYIDYEVGYALYEEEANAIGADVRRIGGYYVATKRGTAISDVLNPPKAT